MKTAMQELEDKLKDNLKWIVMNADYELMDKLFKEGLEKEKEQLLDFGLYVKKNGWVGCKIEDLYEDYYNQNK